MSSGHVILLNVVPCPLPSCFIYMTKNSIYSKVLSRNNNQERSPPLKGLLFVWRKRFQKILEKDDLSWMDNTVGLYPIWSGFIVNISFSTRYYPIRWTEKKMENILRRVSIMLSKGKNFMSLKSMLYIMLYGILLKKLMMFYMQMRRFRGTWDVF